MEVSPLIGLLVGLGGIIAALFGWHRSAVRGARRDGAVDQRARQVDEAARAIEELRESDAKVDRAVELEKQRIAKDLDKDLADNRGDRLGELIAEARALRSVRS